MTDGYRNTNLESWRKVRLIAYCNIPQTKDNQFSIWDFLPLEGDPTPQQIQELKKQQYDKGMQRAADFHKRWKEGKKKKV